MRMHAFFVALAFAFAGAAGPASATDAQAAMPAPAATPAATPPVANPVSNEERMVCRAERTIGSNRVQRVCRSVAQIERDREAARTQMSKSQICSTCGGD